MTNFYKEKECNKITFQLIHMLRDHYLLTIGKKYSRKCRDIYTSTNL